MGTMTVPSAAVAGLSLMVGFAVAQVSGVRVAGGLVLLGAAAWCAQRWWASAGPLTTAGLLLLYAGAFAVSHLLAGYLGAWPSVLLVSSTVAGVTWLAADRPSRRVRTPVA